MVKKIGSSDARALNLRRRWNANSAVNWSAASVAHGFALGFAVGSAGTKHRPKASGSVIRLNDQW